MKEVVSWELIDDCVTDIAFHLKDTGKDFVGVFGVPRGGSLLAVMLSHKLDIPYFDDIEHALGNGEEFIIIDDIADTGKTLNNYKKIDSSEIAYYVTIHEHEQSSVKPDYSVLYKEDKWIVYPWEVKDSTEIQDYLK